MEEDNQQVSFVTIGSPKIPPELTTKIIEHLLRDNRSQRFFYLRLVNSTDILLSLERAC